MATGHEETSVGIGDWVSEGTGKDSRYGKVIAVDGDVAIVGWVSEVIEQAQKPTLKRVPLEEVQKWLGEETETVALVMSYETGAELDGEASANLREASAAAGDTGAVPAYRDGEGVWQYVRPDAQEQMRRLGHDVVTVYVDAALSSAYAVMPVADLTDDDIIEDQETRYEMAAEGQRR